MISKMAASTIALLTAFGYVPHPPASTYQPAAPAAHAIVFFAGVTGPHSEFRVSYTDESGVERDEFVGAKEGSPKGRVWYHAITIVTSERRGVAISASASFFASNSREPIEPSLVCEIEVDGVSQGQKSGHFLTSCFVDLGNVNRSGPPGLATPSARPTTSSANPTTLPSTTQLTDRSESGGSSSLILAVMAIPIALLVVWVSARHRRRRRRTSIEPVPPAPGDRAQSRPGSERVMNSSPGADAAPLWGRPAITHGYERDPHLRVMKICAALGSVVAVIGVVVGCTVPAVFDVPELPRIPSLPSLPPGFPSMPGLPNPPTLPNLPTDLPPIPTMPNVPVPPGGF
jgi:hypothetical protein